MKRHKRGFTLIEIALFLVVTGALFISVTVGVQNSLYQQRYTDTVQHFADFLRNAYSQAMNVQSDGSGRRNKAIYGKLITFGEEYDPSGNKINDGNSRNVIFTYDVIADVKNTGTGSALETLQTLNADVLFVENKTVRPAGYIESYTPKWSASIEFDDSYDLFKGAILIVRHPKSGTVNTYVMKGETIEANFRIKTVADAVKAARAGLDEASTEEEITNAQKAIDQAVGENSAVLKDKLSSFKVEAVDFCINPQSDTKTTYRRNVRIADNARNTSGVEVVNNDNDNKCNGPKP